ncbi:quinolinate synthase NadA [Ammonifex thiophilus]|uniref:Quinolinate synthase n=1 Tax=Ammonifex thiophilus TaxID=444093 RepID=A0A3D8P7F2_9THEO|nr:quinolinate synthase NadA [Ammonifex thiophilus]RDV84249.1 quinolinate synthase NadA [Ammonifex thiophilus]
MTDEVKELQEAILRLKREKEAIILAHYYQRPEIQDIADFVGDSLELSRQAAETPAKVLVFCGVHFMAETAAILSPDKVVLLPDISAGCPMADMATPEAVRARKEALGDCLVVCYVNTSAAVKAESDVACTSANAVEVVGKLPREKTILFIPDRNLGLYVKRFYPDREIVLWEGYCWVHEHVTPVHVRKAKEAHPEAKVMVHPECRPEVIDLADAVASTSGMLRYAWESEAREFIVVTEEGLLHQLRRTCPDKRFYLASPCLECPDMKKITLAKVYESLVRLEPRVEVPRPVRERAYLTVERMLGLKG